ncbi:beta carbonic anhydrase 1, chloroplastic-like isoform X2 [Euphorbia lathyris]|uniref:beta carbonic anhydrase 1, chloroplastic-like isoform X2 n=1 Tax=Euphorbia lathyris TaxID=212925 RepID=UPI0033141CE5
MSFHFIRPGWWLILSYFSPIRVVDAECASYRLPFCFSSNLVKSSTNVRVSIPFLLIPAQETPVMRVASVEQENNRLDVFKEMKLRFLNFKKHKYLEEVEHFQNLAELQSPKFMVIACVASRVCLGAIS